MMRIAPLIFRCSSRRLLTTYTIRTRLPITPFITVEYAAMRSLLQTLWPSFSGDDNSSSPKIAFATHWACNAVSDRHPQYEQPDSILSSKLSSFFFISDMIDENKFRHFIKSKVIETHVFLAGERNIWLIEARSLVPLSSSPVPWHKMGLLNSRLNPTCCL